MGSDRRTDDDYNDHCPECDGTEFSWIDYDPDTKAGRANRAKYCRPWDPAVAMDRIIAEFPVEEPEWTPVKIKPAEPGVYECQFKKLPAWPWPPTEQLTWDGKAWLNDDGDVVKGIKEWRNLQEETV
jgi:hypothetical protein